MKKNFIICLIVLLIGFSADLLSENFQAEPYSFQLLDRTRNTGSVKKLDGDILVISMFVRKVGEPNFTSNDINEYHSSLRSATKWLASQSIAHGKNARFILCEYKNTLYVPSDFSFDADMPITVARKALKNEHAGDEFRKIAKDHGCANYVVIIYTKNHDICSYTVPGDAKCSVNVPELVILNRNTNNNFTTVIAHELLHTFGAIDIYNVDFDKTKYDYGNVFKNSVMRIAHVGLNELEIDDFNLYMIGLIDDFKYWFPDIISHMK